MANTDTSSGTRDVDIDTFVRAESDRYFKVKVDDGYFGKIGHIREPAPVDHQLVVRINRDTLFSYAILDLTEPATITLPDSNGRFMSIVVLNQDHYIKIAAYDAGDYHLTRDLIGTRYAQVAIRTFVNADDPVDVATANELQDRIGFRQSTPGTFELPDWNQEKLAKVRTAVLGLGPFVHSSARMFGDVGEVTEVRHLIGTAGGFGGNRQEDAMYLSVTPEHNDGDTAYLLTVADVPVDGFWSMSIYNSKGYFESNAHNIYSLNNVTASQDPDGSYTIRFGGDPTLANFLPIMAGWNYTVRLYRPRTELLDGAWTFPAALPIA